jgi:predicted amidohydrolase YtcJ
MSVKRCSFPPLLGVLCTAACAQAPPDTIYYNASIVTMSPDHPTAQAVAIQGDRFAAVGSNAEVLKTAGPRTQKVDLALKCVIPGIIETHVHPIAAALSEIDGPVPVVHSVLGVPRNLWKSRKRTARN